MARVKQRAQPFPTFQTQDGKVSVIIPCIAYYYGSSKIYKKEFKHQSRYFPSFEDAKKYAEDYIKQYP